MSIFLKLIDILVFSIVGYFAYQSYTGYALGDDVLNPLLFDMLALLYVMARKWQDVNIISLAFIGLLFKPINMAVMSGAAGMSGFAYYPLIALFNALVMITVWFRPVIFSHFGPFKKRKGWAITNADDGLTIILSLMIIFNILMLIEQTIRRLGADIMWLYNSYEYVQLGFMFASIAVLYFMTTDMAQVRSRLRQDSKPEEV